MKALALILSCISLIACSQQWREGELGISSDELILELESFSQGIQLQSTGSSTNFSASYQNPNTNIYYTFGPGSFGPPSLVLSVRNFRIFNANLDGYSFYDLVTAKVALLDTLENGSRQFLLAVRFELNDGQTYVQYWGSEGHNVFDSTIEIYFRTSTGERITAVSNDLKEGSDDFRRLIRLELINGLGQQVGVIPVLQGFGN